MLLLLSEIWKDSFPDSNLFQIFLILITSETITIYFLYIYSSFSFSPFFLSIPSPPPPFSDFMVISTAI